MATLIFQGSDESVELSDGAPIREACEDAGLPFACSGGLCGTCIVRVIDGGENLSEPTSAELDFLGAEGVKEERMACQCQIMKGTVTIAF
jgi:ferredoxin